MTEKNELQEVKSQDRRRFMELSAKFGFTAAVVAFGSGVLGSTEAVAKVAESYTGQYLRSHLNGRS